MNIYITLDYELYFGQQHGSAEKCMLYPTSELIRIAEKHDVRFSFFVDCGYLIKLNEYKNRFPVLEADHKAVTEQVKYLSDTGHDIQLHIHPHWEDSYFDGQKWIIDVSRYKLSDFDQAAIADIVKRYKQVLVDITGKEIFAYRAGGWCMQPFSKLKTAFVENGISLDSSVFRSGKNINAPYYYDFTSAPDKDIYRFENEPDQEASGGRFTELPISSIHNSPLFFWRLFLLGRKDPFNHKPLGDGRAMPAPGYRKRLLTRFTINPLSIDGYNAQLLDIGLKSQTKRNADHMVVIGHPKALSRYSLKKLEEFIAKERQKHNFTTYSKVFLKNR